MLLQCKVQGSPVLKSKVVRLAVWGGGIAWNGGGTCKTGWLLRR